MRRIKIFIILSMGTFHLPIVSWSVYFYELMMNTELSEFVLKDCGFRVFGVSVGLCKFLTVIGLNTFDPEGEFSE